MPSGVSLFRPGDCAYPASSPVAISIEVAVTPVSLPSSAFAPLPGPHGHARSPNVFASAAGPVVVAAVVVADDAAVVSVVSPTVVAGAAVVVAAPVVAAGAVVLSDASRSLPPQADVAITNAVAQSAMR